MHALTGQIRTGLHALVLVALWAATLPSGVEAQKGAKGCSLDGSSFMTFGNFDPLSNNPLDLQGRVSYRCYNKKSSTIDSNGNGIDDEDEDRGGDKLTVQISLSAGNAGGFNRYMAGSGERLHYNLYMDPQRITVWGDGTGGTRVFSEHAQPNNHLVDVPVYGRIFGAQDVRAGSFGDQLIVTLDF